MRTPAHLRDGWSVDDREPDIDGPDLTVERDDEDDIEGGRRNVDFEAHGEVF